MLWREVGVPGEVLVESSTWSLELGDTMSPLKP